MIEFNFCMSLSFLLWVFKDSLSVSFDALIDLSELLDITTSLIAKSLELGPGACKLPNLVEVVEGNDVQAVLRNEQASRVVLLIFLSILILTFIALIRSGTTCP